MRERDRGDSHPYRQPAGDRSPGGLIRSGWGLRQICRLVPEQPINRNRAKRDGPTLWKISGWVKWTKCTQMKKMVTRMDRMDGIMMEVETGCG